MNGQGLRRRNDAEGMNYLAENASNGSNLAEQFQPANLAGHFGGGNLHLNHNPNLNPPFFGAHLGQQ